MSKEKWMGQFALARQGGRVKRFHSADFLLPQNNAEHSFNVAWMVWVLSRGTARVEVIMAALAHDIAEKKFGDMPGPTKALPGVSAEMFNHEYELMEGLGLNFKITEIEHWWLKLADCLDGLAHSRCELRTSHSEEAQLCEHNYLGYVRSLLEECRPKLVSVEYTQTATDLYCQVLSMTGSFI